MYKKKLRRLGVACMTAAMVLTTVSFPGVAKAEEGTSTQADGVTSSGAGGSECVESKCDV